MNIYKNYAKTRLQIEVLTKKLKEFENDILKEIKDLTTPVKNEFGTYTSTRRMVVKLSEKAVKEQEKVKQEIKNLTDPLKEKIKAIETKDIDSGKAKEQEIVGFRFIRAKEEK